MQKDHLIRINSALQKVNISCLKIEYLAKGANSFIYKLNCDNRILIAKVGINERFRYLDREYRVLSVVRGIGPEPIICETDQESGLQVLIESFIEGFHPMSLENLSVASFGKKIAEYHEINPPDFLQRETWRDFYEKRILPIDNPRDETGERFLEDMVAAEKIGVEVYSSSKGNSPVMVHGDLIPVNLLIDSEDGGGIRILDWESVRLDDAESDLVTFIKAYNLSKKSMEEFLAGYGKTVNMDILRFRLLLHYLQVASWRISRQIPFIKGEEKEKAENELADEMRIIEERMKEEG